MEGETNKIKFVRKTFSMSETYSKKLENLEASEGLKASEIVRRGIDLFEKDINKKKFGYKGAEVFHAKHSKEQKTADLQARIDEIKSMDAFSLNEHLHAIGYMKPDGPLEGVNPESGLTARERIVQNPVTNDLNYVQQNYSDADETVVYEREVFSNIDEIIKDMMKEKFI